jgi:hypothetical protein
MFVGMNSERCQETWLYYGDGAFGLKVFCPDKVDRDKKKEWQKKYCEAVRKSGVDHCKGMVMLTEIDCSGAKSSGMIMALEARIGGLRMRVFPAAHIIAGDVREAVSEVFGIVEALLVGAKENRKEILSSIGVSDEYGNQDSLPVRVDADQILKEFMEEARKKEGQEG